MSTIDKIMRICRGAQNPVRYRGYLEKLPPHEQAQRLKDLLASEAQHGERMLETTNLREHGELNNA